MDEYKRNAENEKKVEKPEKLEKPEKIEKTKKPQKVKNVKGTEAPGLKEKLRGFFEDGSFRQNEERIQESNLKFYKIFTYMMAALLILLYGSTFFVDYAANLMPIYGVFISLSVLEALVIYFANPKNNHWVTYACMFGIVKAYLFCILTSVVFNRDGVAITFYIFMILIPVCFLLRPWVMYLVQILAALAFCVLTILMKNPEFIVGDVVNCIFYFLISLIIANQITRLRMNNVSMAKMEHRHRVKLEEQRDLLTIALNSANMCVWEYDCDTRKIMPTYVPTQYEGLIRQGVRLPDVAVDSGAIHEKSIGTFCEMFHKAQRGEDYIQCEVLSKTFGTGDYRWFQVNMNLESGVGTRHHRYIGTSEDITERKNREMAYEEQVRILDGTNDANLITKGRWNLTTNRKEMHEKKGSQSLELQEMDTYDHDMMILIDAVFPGEKRKKMRSALQRQNLIDGYHKGIDQYTFEYQRVTGDEASIWVKMEVRICQAPGKDDIIGFGFSYDITEEMFNRSIIDRLVNSEYDFLGTVDIQTGKSIVRSMQPSMRRTMDELHAYNNSVDYGSSSEVAARMSVIPEELEFVIQAMKLENVVAHLKTSKTYIITFTTQEDGKQYKKKLEYCYLDDSKESLLYYRSDISELYQQEQKQLMEVKKALTQVKEANAAKTDFLSRMSHDMRTPMNGIIGMTRMTQEIQDLPEQVYKNLSAIADSSHFLLSLINDTLDMSRIERNKVTLVPEVIDIAQMAGNILAMIQPNIDEKKIHLEYVPHNQGVAYVRADKVRLQQVFLNILSNSIKFTPEGGTIHIEVFCLEIIENVMKSRFVFTDTGIGMSREFLDRIYEPFSQENRTMTSRQVGTGLGMSIVKNMVELMGGSIDIQSEQGKGTTVIIDLDLEIVWDYVPKEQETKQDVDAVLLGKHVLLVEDHPLNQAIAIAMLEKKGMIVDTAENGQEAVDTFCANPLYYYDVILMDIQMPVMNGIEAARAIRGLTREDAKTTLMIAMSANAFDEDVRKSKEAGMDDHLSKPINPEQVYQTIASLL